MKSVYTLINKVITKFFGKIATDEEVKQMEGEELANDIMLKDIYTFLLIKDFYGEEGLFSKLRARKDIFHKDGKLRELLQRMDIKTRYDLVFNMNSSDLYLFGPYWRIMTLYRNTIIEKSFWHRLAECH